MERGKGMDTQFRLCVHTRDGWGRCMHCDWKRRQAVMPVLKQYGILERVAGFSVEPEEYIPPVELPKDFQALTHVYDDLDRQARKYIIGRGVLPSQIREEKIGVSYSGRYAYRVIFPVYVNKQLKAINARDFTGSQTPKYLTSRGDKYLYRFDPEARTVVFSEGSIKALRIAQATSANSSALLGHSLTEHQVQQIEASKCQEVILFPDPDRVGRRGFVRVADQFAQLQKRVSLKIVWPVPQPADELPLAEISKMLAVPLAYSWETKQTVLP
jgi:hypothetical protein